MKSFTLTIIYDGHKTTSKLETDTQIKEETTLEAHGHNGVKV